MRDDAVFLIECNLERLGIATGEKKDFLYSRLCGQISMAYHLNLITLEEEDGYVSKAARLVVNHNKGG